MTPAHKPKPFVIINDAMNFLEWKLHVTLNSKGQESSSQQEPCAVAFKGIK